MQDQIDANRAGVVLELEADLIESRAAIARRDPKEHADLWARVSKRLWSKVFQMSSSGQEGRVIFWWEQRPTQPERPPMPEQLANGLAGAVSPRQAAIDMLASAATAVSGHADRRDAEAELLQLNLMRFLERPAGHNHKVRVNESLARSLRAAGLEVQSLE